MKDINRECALEEIETARDRMTDVLRCLDRATAYLRDSDGNDTLYQLCRLIKGTVWHTREQIITVRSEAEERET